MAQSIYDEIMADDAAPAPAVDVEETPRARSLYDEIMSDEALPDIQAVPHKMGHGERMIKSFNRGAFGMIGTTLEGLGRMTGSDALKEYGAASNEIASEFPTPAVKTDFTDPAFYAESIGSVAGSALPSMALAAPAMGGGMLPFLAASAVPTLGAAVGEVAKNYKDETGKEIGDAALYSAALPHAGVELALDAATLRVIGMIPGGKGVISKLAKKLSGAAPWKAVPAKAVIGGTMESTEEGLQGLIGGTPAALDKGENPLSGERLASAGRDFLHTLPGGIALAGLGAGFTTATQPKAVPDAKKPEVLSKEEADRLRLSSGINLLGEGKTIVPPDPNGRLRLGDGSGEEIDPETGGKIIDILGAGGSSLPDEGSPRVGTSPSGPDLDQADILEIATSLNQFNSTMGTRARLDAERQARSLGLSELEIAGTPLEELQARVAQGTDLTVADIAATNAAQEDTFSVPQAVPHTQASPGLASQEFAPENSTAVQTSGVPVTEEMATPPPVAAPTAPLEPTGTKRTGKRWDDLKKRGAAVGIDEAFIEDRNNNYKDALVAIQRAEQKVKKSASGAKNAQVPAWTPAWMQSQAEYIKNHPGEVKGLGLDGAKKQWADAVSNAAGRGDAVPQSVLSEHAAFASQPVAATPVVSQKTPVGETQAPAPKATKAALVAEIMGERPAAYTGASPETAQSNRRSQQTWDKQAAAAKKLDIETLTQRAEESRALAAKYAPAPKAGPSPAEIDKRVLAGEGRLPGMMPTAAIPNKPTETSVPQKTLTSQEGGLFNPEAQVPERQADMFTAQQAVDNLSGAALQSAFTVQRGPKAAPATKPAPAKADPALDALAKLTQDIEGGLFMPRTGENASRLEALDTMWKAYADKLTPQKFTELVASRLDPVIGEAATDALIKEFVAEMDAKKTQGQPGSVGNSANVSTSRATPALGMADLNKDGIFIKKKQIGKQTVEAISGLPFEINGRKVHERLKEVFGKTGDRNNVSWFGATKEWTVWRRPDGRSTEELLLGVVSALRNEPREAAGGGPGVAADGSGSVGVGEQPAGDASVEAADMAGLNVNSAAYVSAGTKALIDRGAKFGIPQEVLDWQVEDTALALRAYADGKNAFVIANAPGSGKTFVLGGIIKELLAKGETNIIYVTLRQPLIDQNKRDLADYGADKVKFVTYAGIRKAGAVNTNGAIIIFDEAHKVKNLQSQQGAGASTMSQGAKFTIYSSATPGESIMQLEYISASGVFDKEGGFIEWAKRFGLKTIKIDNGYGKKIEVPDTKSPIPPQFLKKARRWLVDKGVFTNRPMRIPGNQIDSKFKKIDVSPEYSALYAKLEGVYLAALGDLDRFHPDFKGISMHRENMFKRVMESAKIDAAVERAADLIGQGRRVVMFSETRSDKYIGRFRMSNSGSTSKVYSYSEMVDLYGEWQRAKAMAMPGERVGPPPFASFIMRIADAMNTAGLDMELPSVSNDIVNKLTALGHTAVMFTGEQTEAKANANLKQWLDGKADFMMATMEKGGTGLSLHDTTGKTPTAQVVINLPWTATQVDQVAGRTARYGMVGDVIQEWVFAGNIAFDAKLGKRVGARMRSLGALVQGMDVSAGERIENFDFEHDDAALMRELSPDTPAANTPTIASEPEPIAEDAPADEESDINFVKRTVSPAVAKWIRDNFRSGSDKQIFTDEEKEVTPTRGRTPFKEKIVVLIRTGYGTELATGRAKDLETGEVIPKGAEVIRVAIDFSGKIGGMTMTTRYLTLYPEQPAAAPAAEGDMSDDEELNLKEEARLAKLNESEFPPGVTLSKSERTLGNMNFFTVIDRASLFPEDTFPRGGVVVTDNTGAEKHMTLVQARAMQKFTEDDIQAIERSRASGETSRTGEVTYLQEEIKQHGGYDPNISRPGEKRRASRDKLLNLSPRPGTWRIGAKGADDMATQLGYESGDAMEDALQSELETGNPVFYGGVKGERNMPRTLDNSGGMGDLSNGRNNEPIQGRSAADNVEQSQGGRGQLQPEDELRSDTQRPASPRTRDNAQARQVPPAPATPRLKTTREQALADLRRMHGVDPRADIVDTSMAIPPSIVAELRAITGKEIYIVRGVSWNGVKSDAGRIFVDETADEPILKVIGHELTHSGSEFAKKKLISRLRIAADPKRAAEFMAKRQAQYQSQLGKTITEDLLWEEFAGDFVGEQLMDEAFWNRVMQKDPSLFRQLATKVINWLRRLGVKVQPMDYYFKHDGARMAEAVAAAQEFFETLRGPASQSGESYWPNKDYQQTQSGGAATQAGNVKLGAAADAAIKGGNKFMPRTSDAEYLRAAEAGDTATAQRMVDEAAKRAGYTTRVYRSASEKIKKFRTDRSAWFTAERYDAEDYASGATPSDSVFDYFLADGKFADLDSAAVKKVIRAAGVKVDFSDLMDVTEKAAEIKAALSPEYDGFRVKHYGLSSDGIWHYNIFSSSQTKSADPITYSDSGAIIPLSERFDESSDDIRYMPRTGAATINSTWDIKTPDWLTWADKNITTRLQDKDISVKRLMEALKTFATEMGGTVATKVLDAKGHVKDMYDVYAKMSLATSQISDGLNRFSAKYHSLLNQAQLAGVTIDKFGEYLLAMHAPEANERYAKINPDFPDGGSGMTNAEAATIIDALTPEKKRLLDKYGLEYRDLIWDMQDELVASGQTSQGEVDAWRKTYGQYVPLLREGHEAEMLPGLGMGIAVTGEFSKYRIGSSKKAINPIYTLPLLIEKAIRRGVNARASQSMFAVAAAVPNEELYIAVDPLMNKPREAKVAQAKMYQEIDRLFESLALNPTAANIEETEQQVADLEEEIRRVNRNAWPDYQKVVATLIKMGLERADAENIMGLPTQKYFNRQAGMVATRYNKSLAGKDNVLPVRINGEDKYVVFNKNNARAVEMAAAMRNKDVAQMGDVLATFAKVSRWIASVNTRFNPVFGPKNLIRDIGTAMLNLASTPIAGERAKVVKYITQNMPSIWKQLRAERDGLDIDLSEPTDGSINWARVADEARRAGMPTGFYQMLRSTETQTERVKAMVEGGKMPKVDKILEVVGNTLSDFNEMLEMSTRLAVYQAARESGMTEQQSGMIGKDITVNFDRRGTATTTANALYAFFNASLQGTERLGRTMLQFNDKGQPRLSPAGMKIFAGGMALGVAQAVMLAMHDVGDDDEPKDFLRERNLLFGLGGGKWAAVPMPLGYNVIPSIGRVMAELTFSGGKNAEKKAASLFNLLLGAANPMGGESSMVQNLVPTAADWLVNLGMNRDWNGKPIYRKDTNTLKPKPGFERQRESATLPAKLLSHGFDWITGGRDGQPGLYSPTPEEWDYIAGYFGGGMLKELIKVGKFAVDSENTPSFRRPLIGAYYFTTDELAGQTSNYYENVTKVNSAVDRLKHASQREGGREKTLANYPEAKLGKFAQNAQTKIDKLSDRHKKLVANDAPSEQLRENNKRIQEIMKAFNDKVKAVRSE